MMAQSKTPLWQQALQGVQWANARYDDIKVKTSFLELLALIELVKLFYRLRRKNQHSIFTEKAKEAQKSQRVIKAHNSDLQHLIEKNMEYVKSIKSQIRQLNSQYMNSQDKQSTLFSQI